MTAIKERLLLYDELPPDERAELDAYLAEHPDAAALLAEGRALRDLLAEARSGSAEPSSAELAEYVATRHLGPQPPPPDLAALEERVERAAERPEVRAQLAALEERLEALAAGAADPATQFERLTGRPLDPAPPPEAPARFRAWRAPARSPRPAQRRASFRRLVVVATLLGAFLYGGLYAASEATRSPAERLAALDEVPRQFEGLRLRGSDGQVDPATDRYAAALDALHEARSGALGLFPRYDRQGLDRAVGFLLEVTEIEPPGSALGLEAWYLIGRIRLHQGETAQAREALQRVIVREGPSAPAAQRLLDALGPAA